MARRQPYVPAEVRKAAILDATVALLGERGPDGVTVRAIAERAGVHHSIIFRHFGDKASLVRTALVGELAGWAEAARRATDAEAAFVDGFRHVVRRPKTARALGHVLLADRLLYGDQRAFPVVDAHVDVLVVDGWSEQAARDLSVALVALIAGWIAGEEFWMRASRRRSRGPARAAIEDAIRAMVRSAPR